MLQDYVIEQNRIEVKLYVTHLTFETLSSTYKEFDRAVFCCCRSGVIKVYTVCYSIFLDT